MNAKSRTLNETALELVTQITDHGIEGAGPLCSAEELAHQYRETTASDDPSAAINSMIRWESSKSFANGFATGVGGLVTLPVAVPWSVYSSWVIQARLVAAIVELHGWSSRDDRVRTFILLTLLGNSAKEVLREVGITVARGITLKTLRKIPGRVLIEINKRIGFRLLAKTGEKALIRLTRVVPIAGGLVGGMVEAAATMTVGKATASIFLPNEAPIAA